MQTCRFLLLALLLPASACGRREASPLAEQAAMPDTSLSARIEAFLAPYVRAGFWSGAVAVVRGDSVLHRAGYGRASIEHDVMNTPATRFGVASVTKAFTAIAAARLSRAGIIDRQATIDRWLPDFPSGDRITIDHLIAHRSGIPDTDDLAWFRLGQRVPHTIAELVDSLGKATLEFEPGSRRDYSNGGYTVLAAVLSAATSLAFHDVLEQWVFTPARMPGSGDLSSGDVVPGLAAGYTLGVDGALVPGPYVHPSSKTGAGSAYTTIDDVIAFHRALREDRLLPSTLRDSLFRAIDSPFGQQRIYFGGRGPSYTAAIQIFPQAKLLVAALGNNYGRLNEEITDGLAGLVFGEWQDERVAKILGRKLPFAAQRMAAAALDRIAGRYRHQWGFEFTLERKGSELVYVFPEHGIRTPLIALSDTLLVSPWQWAELEWAGDGEKRIVWRWLDFPDRSWRVERLGSAPETEARGR